MDTQSLHVVTFLDALEQEMQRLGGDVKRHYAYRPGGRMPGMPMLALTDGGFALVLPIKGTDGGHYELAVDVAWNRERWTIATGLYVDSDRGGQATVQQLPERSATGLEALLEHLHAAVGDLTRVGDLIP
jgi:hypothetical protein